MVVAKNITNSDEPLRGDILVEKIVYICNNRHFNDNITLC